MKLSIIIPVHNRKIMTQNILKQIYEQISQISSRQIISVIVVDDGSTDGTKELINQDFPEVHLLKGDGNLWWTGSIVTGMKYALENLNPDYFIWLNDDIILAPEFMIELTKLCESDREYKTIYGGIVRDKKYPNWIVYSGIKKGKSIRHIEWFNSGTEVESDTVAGNIAIIPRTIVKEIGMPDSHKFPHHGGDYEFSKVAKRKGFKIICSSNLQAETYYTIEDIIRYMPYWMQWHIQPSFSKRWEVIKGLTSIKSNQNIWLFVNIKHYDRDYIPIWRYYLCYLDKILKLLLIDLLPQAQIEPKIEQYLEYWSVPLEIVTLIKKRIK